MDCTHTLHFKAMADSNRYPCNKILASPTSGSAFFVIL